MLSSARADGAGVPHGRLPQEFTTLESKETIKGTGEVRRHGAKMSPMALRAPSKAPFQPSRRKA